MATTTPLQLQRIKTGVNGLDELISGGLLKGDIHILVGGPGTGKTIFASNIAYNSIKAGERVVYASFEESAEFLKRNMKRLGVDFDPLEKEGKVKIMDLDALGGKELESNVAVLLAALDDTKSSFLVVDSLTALLTACETTLELRAFIKMIYREIKRRGATMLVTVSLGGEAKLGPEGYICDSVLLLENVVEDYQFRTRLMVMKMRATEHSRKYHSVIFTPQLTVSKY